MPANE
jgi:hypothetical protein